MKIKGCILLGILMLGSGIAVTGYAATRPDFKEKIVYGRCEHLTKSYTEEEVKNITSIVFEGAFGGISIIGTEAKEISMDLVYYSSNPYSTEVNEDSHALRIEQSNSDSTHWWNSIGIGALASSKIYVPAGLDLQITQSAGGVELKNVQAINCSLNIQAGGIDMEDCSFQSLTVELSSGGASFENIKCDEIIATVSAGGIEFEGDIFKKGHFEVQAGGIDVQLLRDKSCYSVNGIGSGASSITTSSQAGGVEISYKD